MAALSHIIGTVVARVAGQAKVANLDNLVSVEQDVAGGQIAMHKLGGGGGGGGREDIELIAQL